MTDETAVAYGWHTGMPTTLVDSGFDLKGNIRLTEFQLVYMLP